MDALVGTCIGLTIGASSQAPAGSVSAKLVAAVIGVLLFEK